MRANRKAGAASKRPQTGTVDMSSILSPAILSPKNAAQENRRKFSPIRSQRHDNIPSGRGVTPRKDAAASSPTKGVKVTTVRKKVKKSGEDGNFLNSIPKPNGATKKKKLSHTLINNRSTEGPINIAFKNAVICSLYDDEGHKLVTTETSKMSADGPETLKTKISSDFQDESSDKINSEQDLFKLLSVNNDGIFVLGGKTYTLNYGKFHKPDKRYMPEHTKEDDDFYAHLCDTITNELKDHESKQMKPQSAYHPLHSAADDRFYAELTKRVSSMPDQVDNQTATRGMCVYQPEHTKEDNLFYEQLVKQASKPMKPEQNLLYHPEQSADDDQFYERLAIQAQNLEKDEPSQKKSIYHPDQTAQDDKFYADLVNQYSQSAYKPEHTDEDNRFYENLVKQTSSMISDEKKTDYHPEHTEEDNKFYENLIKQTSSMVSGEKKTDYHPEHTEEDNKFYENLVKQTSSLVSGEKQTDYHPKHTEEDDKFYQQLKRQVTMADVQPAKSQYHPQHTQDDDKFYKDLQQQVIMSDKKPDKQSDYHPKHTKEDDDFYTNLARQVSSNDYAPVHTKKEEDFYATLINKVSKEVSQEQQKPTQKSSTYAPQHTQEDNDFYANLKKNLVQQVNNEPDTPFFKGTRQPSVYAPAHTKDDDDFYVKLRQSAAHAKTDISELIQSKSKQAQRSNSIASFHSVEDNDFLSNIDQNQKLRQSSTSEVVMRQQSTLLEEFQAAKKEVTDHTLQVLKASIEEANTNKDDKNVGNIIIQSVAKSVNQRLNREKKNLEQQIQEHELKLNNLQKQIEDSKQSKESNLHLAFLFACPFVFGDNEKLKVPVQLNFTSEYQEIIKAAKKSEMLIKIKKRQGTQDNMSDILTEKPMALHFSGHGFKNDEKLGSIHYDNPKGGDFLLLESDDGKGEFVSSNQLQEIMEYSKAKLKLVFVASCHSETIGKMFNKAGAQHVICMSRDKEMQDAAAIMFTTNFYSQLFKNSWTICEAFRFAQTNLRSRFAQHADDFLLFKNCCDCEEKQCQKVNQHKCPEFGPFEDGQYVENDIKVILNNVPPKTENLIGRAKEQYKLYKMIINKEVNRLINVFGITGSGKSTLVKHTLHYINQRRLLTGGQVYLNLRNMRNIEVFIKRFIDTLVQFKNTGLSTIDIRKKKPVDLIKEVFDEVRLIFDPIVVFLDNAEQLIANAQKGFREIIQHFLVLCPNVQIILTSRLRLGSLEQISEELLVVKGILPMHAAQLLKDKAGRAIPYGETKELLQTKPDEDRYQKRKNKKEPKKLEDHHLFELLGGNPQAIILLAPMLSDQEKSLKLVDLYKTVASHSNEDLEGQGIENSLANAIKVGLQVSLETVFDGNPIVEQIFQMLAYLPGGVTESRLEKIINKCSDIKGDWRQAIKELVDHDIMTEEKDKNGEIVYAMSFNMTQAAQSMVDHQEMKSIYNSIVNSYLVDLNDYYLKSQTDEALTRNIAEQIVLYEQNLWYLISLINKNGESIVNDILMSTLNLPGLQVVKTQSKLNQQKIDQRKMTYLQSVKEASQRDKDLINSFRDSIKVQQTESIFKEKPQQIEMIKKEPVKRQSFRAKDVLRSSIKKVMFANKMSKSSIRKSFRKKKSSLDLNGQPNEDDLEEIVDSDPEDVVASFRRELSLKVKDDDSSKPQSKKELLAKALLKILDKQLQTIEDNNNLDLSNMKNLHHKTTAPSPKKTNRYKIDHSKMNEEELLIIQYVANLALIGNYSIVMNIVESFMSQLQAYSNVFSGNLLRMYVFIQYQNLKLQLIEQDEQNTREENEKKNKEKINDMVLALGMAEETFMKEKNAQCHWGVALVNYQLGLLYQEFDLVQNDEKIQVFEKAIKLFEEIYHRRGLALCNQNISIIYKTIGLKDKSLAYQEKYANYITEFRLHEPMESSAMESYLSIKRNKGNSYSLQTELALYATNCAERAKIHQSARLKSTLGQALRKKLKEYSNKIDDDGTPKGRISVLDEQEISIIKEQEQDQYESSSMGSEEHEDKTQEKEKEQTQMKQVQFFEQEQKNSTDQKPTQPFQRARTKRTKDGVMR